MPDYEPEPDAVEEMARWLYEVGEAAMRANKLKPHHEQARAVLERIHAVALRAAEIAAESHLCEGMVFSGLVREAAERAGRGE